MAYKIKIKHNVEGKSIPLTLKYTDESVHFPNISVNLTDTDKVVTLSGWGENEEGIDVEKISVVEKSYEDDENVYNINSVNIGLDTGPDTASEEAKEEYENYENTVPDETDSKHDEIIEAYLNKQYDLVKTLILSDNSKIKYDFRNDLRTDDYWSRLSDADFYEEFGDSKECAIIMEKVGNRIPYASIYFGSSLLEANSQYSRIMGYYKCTAQGQSINSEGRKAPIHAFGYMGTRGTLHYDIRTPDLKESDIIVKDELFSGDENNASILSICFAPDYTEASTSYKPCSGVVYVDGCKLTTGRKPYYRVKIDNGQHVVFATDIKFKGKTGWETFGNHYITTPLYSDNILKIPVFSDEADHGMYNDLYQQGKSGRWGLPSRMFRGSAPTPPEEMENEGWPAIPMNYDVIPASLYVRYIQKSDGNWDAYPFWLDCNLGNVQIPVKYGDTQYTMTVSASDMPICRNVYHTQPGVVVEIPINTGNFLYSSDQKAYVIGEVRASYDVWSGQEHVSLLPSNSDSANFDYWRNDINFLLGELNPSLATDIYKQGTRAINGELETLFENGAYSASTFASAYYPREYSSNMHYYRVVKFTKTGRHVIGPFRNTIYEEGYTLKPWYSLGNQNKLNVIADMGFNDITSNFAQASIKYTIDGVEYTGSIYVSKNEEGPAEYILANGFDSRVIVS